jgi:hypothetical protein
VFAENIALSVGDSLKDLTAGKPERLIIYRANADGDVIGPKDTSCTDCYVYAWNATSKTWVNQNAPNSWTQAERLADACAGTLPSVGVWVQATQPALTRLFGPSRTLTHKTVIRLEPVADSECP